MAHLISWVLVAALLSKCADSNFAGGTANPKKSEAKRQLQDPPGSTTMDSPATVM